jgi:hypothetical protein
MKDEKWGFNWVKGNKKGAYYTIKVRNKKYVNKKRKESNTAREGDTERDTRMVI